MITGVLIGLAVVATDVPQYGKKLAANNNIPSRSLTMLDFCNSLTGARSS